MEPIPTHADLPNAFPALDEATEQALRESIRRFGVILPIIRDQHGRILDGHHRSRLAADLGIDPTEIVMPVDNDDHARALSETLNNDRRHMEPDQRREIVAALRGAGHSTRAIAKAVGVSHTQVQKDISGGNQLPPDGLLPEPAGVVGQGDGESDKVVGQDGKRYPAKRRSTPAPATAPKQPPPSREQKKEARVHKHLLRDVAGHASTADTIDVMHIRYVCTPDEIAMFIQQLDEGVRQLPRLRRAFLASLPDRARKE